MSNLHILVQDPENYALLRSTLPSRPNKGVPPFQETATEQRILYAIYNLPLQRKNKHYSKNPRIVRIRT